MAKVTNTFIKSKLNKDLDARLIPNGEYRDAVNVQVSRSEGDSVGSLENVLGNKLVKDFGNTDLTCIGYLTDDTSGLVYLFFTDYIDQNQTIQRTYNNLAENYIFSYNSVTEQSILLVQGAFLNFSKTNPIFGINLIENLLFFTDNRNQPRKINVNLANPSGLATPTYYTAEDQISVAKYNPYRSIEVFQETSGNPAPVETTMKNVTSLFNPNGGTALADQNQSSTTINIDNLSGDLIKPNQSYSPSVGAKVSLSSGSPAVLTDTGQTVASYLPLTGTPIVSVTLTGSITVLDNQMLVFNPNPNYDGAFAGDPDYLSDLFVRFSYRFKFDDGEYSIMAPFTQIAFIPKQDGYFMYVKKDGVKEVDDQSESYRSSIVSFMENKVDQVKLIIPKPDTLAGQTISEAFKISEIDILMKESDGLAVKVIDTLQVENITPNTYGDIEYQYKSTKPFKTLPNSETIRVYDKVPVRALAQETTGNRVVYGNFQNKHTPPPVLDYTVAATEKSSVDLKNGSATTTAAGGSNNVNVSNSQGTIEVGSIVSGTDVVEGTVVTQVTGSGLSVTNVAVTPNFGAFASGTTLKFIGTNNPERTVSKVEYPNSSLKQNRNYQVGIVLSDRYGRQSSVILNDANQSSTIYSPYINKLETIQSWAGNSIKLLFNSGISPVFPIQKTEWPGIYNGDSNSVLYNPLGWYSYKVVVKQSEQEYYNVYLPGIMASYPENQNLELGNTSHVVLIGDNINKVPRDLLEVGPDQKQFRSSVRLFGRVQNTSVIITTSPNNFGKSNEQYYPSTIADTASIISTMRDMFEVDSTVQAQFKQFYDFESNPLIARINTTFEIGQISTTTPFPATPPGLQYLAVYETEAVDSQLDIYWETNTTGLITSLNQAVLQGTTGVNGFSSFDTTNWSEGLVNTGNILNQAFTLQDTLGQDITLSGSDSFTLVSVINGFGQNVNAPSSIGPYFGLVVSSNTFQVRINSAYYNNVYFNTDSRLRAFTFNFRSVIYDINSIPTTTLFSQFASPSNVNPTLTSTPVSGSTIRSNRNLTSTLATLVGVNGANNSSLAGGSLSYNIVSQTVTGQSNQVNYFELTNPVISNNSTTTLKNINSSTGAQSYDVTVGLSDPGSTIQSTYTIDMAVQPNLVREVEFFIRQPFVIKNCVMITLTQASSGAGQAGFYLYTGFPTQSVYFQDLVNSSGGGTVNSPIQIDRTNAITSGTTCGIWFYHPTSQTALETLFFNACTPSGSFLQGVTYSTVSASNYIFEVI